MIFETERLLVRELEMKDVPFLYDYGKNEKVVEYQDWGPITLPDAEQFYHRSKAQRDAEWRKEYIYGIILKESNELIGDCGYHYLNDSMESAEIGYNLNPTIWRKGYGTEMIKHLVTHILFKHPKIEIYAECDSRNIGSRSVLERNNFNLIELRENDVEQKGVRIDNCKYRFMKD